MGLLAAGVADEMSRPPRPLHGVGHQLLAERLVAQVAGNREADAAFRLDQARSLRWASGSSVGEIVDRDIGAFAREGDGRGAAHAGIAAGDQRLAPAQPARPAIALLAMIGPRSPSCAARPGQGCDCLAYRWPWKSRRGIIGWRKRSGARRRGRVGCVACPSREIRTCAAADRTARKTIDGIVRHRCLHKLLSNANRRTGNLLH